MGKRSLKGQNNVIIIIFIGWSIALFLVCFNGFEAFWPNLHERLITLKKVDSLFSFLTPIILGVLVGITPASWKAILVFWRIRNPLPGCRAFSIFAYKDPRVDIDILTGLIGELPLAPDRQNAKWYGLYKKVQENLTVVEAHRAFLLYRDLCSIAFISLVVCTPIIYWLGSSEKGGFIFLLANLLEYMLFSIVARNHGNSFVCNTLAEYVNVR